MRSCRHAPPVAAPPKQPRAPRRKPGPEHPSRKSSRVVSRQEGAGCFASECSVKVALLYCIGGFSLQTVVFASWWDYLQTLCKVSKG
jgi:hypothetical protein